MDNKLLDIYSDYLISQNQFATATGLSHILDGLISHDKITRFLNQNDFGSKDLWEYIKPKVRCYEQNIGGVLIIDDTIEEKTYTDENEIICWHFSHAKNKHVKGINILSCLIRYGEVAFPIAFETVRKDMHFCDVKTRQEYRKASVTKNQMFQTIIKQAVTNQVKFEYILADSWFGAKKNMEYVHYELQKKFIFGMKSNRLVALTDDERKKGQYHKLDSLNLEDGEKKNVWLKDMSFSVTLMKKIFKNEDLSTGTLYLVTNDQTNDADHIYKVYQKRWRIEDYHKSIKQNASLEKSPTKVVRSQKNHLFAVIIAYCKLELLRIKTSLNHFAIKYKLLMRANQIAFNELKNLHNSS